MRIHNTYTVGGIVDAVLAVRLPQCGIYDIERRRRTTFSSGKTRCKYRAVFRGGMCDFGEELVADGAMVKKCCGGSENMLRFCW